MQFSLDNKPLTNAEIIRDYLKEQTSFNLYPEEEHTRSIHEELQEEYDRMFAKADAAKASMEFRSSFLESLKEDLLVEGIYSMFVESVLENMAATDREYEVAYDSIKHFVEDEGVENLLRQFKYQNDVLADLAHFTESYYNYFVEGIDCKIKEGLPEDQAYEIEDKDIDSFIVGCKCKCPKDITNKITKRVEDAVDDFIDDKKKSQFKIQQIYQKAKQKIEDYNNSQASLGNMNQSDIPMDGMDPEVGIDNNLNAKLDMQQNQDIANLNDPSMQPQPNAANPIQMTPAQEALAWAKNQETMILENNYSVLDAMVRVLMESTYKNEILKESYMGDNGKTSLRKVLNDAKAMYTVLETFNILNIITLNEEYLENMIQEMHKGIE